MCLYGNNTEGTLQQFFIAVITHRAHDNRALITRLASQCDGGFCEIVRSPMEAWRYSALNTQFFNLQQKLLSTMQSSK